MLLQGQQLGWSADVLRDVVRYMRRELEWETFTAVWGKPPQTALLEVAALLESGQADQPRPDC